MSLPLILRTSWIFVIFLCEIAFLHLLLVVLPWFRPTARGWKKAGYFIVAFAALGIFGAVSSARQFVANNMYAFYGPVVESEFASLKHSADFYATSGAVCRTFNRGPFSPPVEEFNKTQQEFNEVCEWFKRVASTLPKEAPSDNSEIDWGGLPSPPPVTSGDLVDFIRQFRQSLDTYNAKARARRELGLATERSELEKAVLYFSPVLLSFALALQATKVTGELRSQ